MENATSGEIRIGDATWQRAVVLDSGSARAQAILGEAHRARLEVSCLCRGSEKSVPMHIARRGASFFLRRNPGSANLHHPSCDAARSPLSDLTQQFGANSATETATGSVVLRLAERLTEGAQRPPKNDPRPRESLQVSSSHRGGQITELMLLRYLWAEAELARWHPRMEGKRSWGVVRHQLESVLRRHWFGRTPATTQTFIPQPYRVDPQQRQGVDPFRDASLRVQHMMHSQYEALAERSTNGAMPVMHVIAPLAALGIVNDEKTISLRHMPDVALLDSNNVIARFEANNHRAVLRATASNTTSKLVLLLRIIRDDEGDYRVRSIAAIELDGQYLPYKTAQQAEILDYMRIEQRFFAVNITSIEPSAAYATLLDTPHETAVYVGVPPQPLRNSYIWDTELYPEPPKLPPLTVKGNTTHEQ
jgi:Protein of unknown function (DUF1173)